MEDSKILESVATSLYQSTGDRVYLEWKENSMVFPCFVINIVNPKQDLHRGDMYEHKLDLDILYFLNDEDTISDTRALLEIPSKLYSALEYIQIGDRIQRGEEMKYRITDGVLHFFVTYENIIRSVTKPIERMKHMQLIERVKHGE